MTLHAFQQYRFWRAASPGATHLPGLLAKGKRMTTVPQIPSPEEMKTSKRPFALSLIMLSGSFTLAGSSQAAATSRRWHKWGPWAASVEQQIQGCSLALGNLSWHQSPLYKAWQNSVNSFPSSASWFLMLACSGHTWRMLLTCRASEAVHSQLAAQPDLQHHTLQLFPVSRCLDLYNTWPKV